MFAAISLHILSATIWVGGMFFAYMFLRPVAAEELQPAERLTVWTDVFSKFFVWVWAAILLLIVTGHYMIFVYGGFKHIGVHIHIMLTLGYIMMGIFMHVYFAPFKRMKNAVAQEDWPTAATNLNQIRKMVAVNLTLGLITIVVASAGRFI